MDIERVYEPDQEAMKKALRLAAGIPEPETEPSKERSVVYCDGVLYDRDTGEIIELPSDKERFTIDTLEKAEWVLERMLNAEAALAEIQARKEAIVANLTSMEKEEQRRVDGLHGRFDQELGSFAKKALEGQKSKTLKTPFGTVSFRVNRGKHEIIDMDAAITWAISEELDVVHSVESVNVSDLMRLGVLPDEAPWLKTIPPHEDVYVRTGLKKGGGAE